jgi:hypothetical protein
MRSPRRTNRDRQPGFIMIDVLAGLFLLAALASAMAVAMHVRQLAAQKFGDQRQAIEIARETIADLQSHHPIPTESQYPGVKISVAPTTQSSDHLSWRKVTVELNGRQATLEGIADTESAGAKP